MESIFQNPELDHIGIIVKNINEARDKFSKLFGPPFHSENLPEQKIILDKYKLNNSTIEVFQPYPDNEHLQKFLSRYGQGIHHICIGNITDSQIDKLRESNYKLVYSDWHTGAQNSRINFVHPSYLCKVLLELKKK
ncbi:MAG: VOC family protein [Planctomycetota bacterium]